MHLITPEGRLQRDVPAAMSAFVYEYYGETFGAELCDNARGHVGAFIKLCHEVCAISLNPLFFRKIERWFGLQ
jgi:hypothetical protein